MSKDSNTVNVNDQTTEQADNVSGTTSTEQANTVFTKEDVDAMLTKQRRDITTQHFNDRAKVEDKVATLTAEIARLKATAPVVAAPAPVEDKPAPIPVVAQEVIPVEASTGAKMLSKEDVDKLLAEKVKQTEERVMTTAAIMIQESEQRAALKLHRETMLAKENLHPDLAALVSGATTEELNASFARMKTIQDSLTKAAAEEAKKTATETTRRAVPAHGTPTALESDFDFGPDVGDISDPARRSAIADLPEKEYAELRAKMEAKLKNFGHSR